MNPSTTRSSTQQAEEAGRPHARFAATSWTAVVAAGQSDTPQSREALTRLCEDYWEPLHAYVRRSGYSEHEAKDLTQEFFLRLLSKNAFAAADRSKGKFRTFLLTALNYFLVNEYRRASADKRGGGQKLVSIDEQDEDHEPRHEPASHLSPDVIYEQTWARTVFRQARERLAEEYASTGKANFFAELGVFLDGTPDPRGYHPVAERLQMTPNAVGVAVYRMRQRLGELIRAQIGHTLVNPTPAEIEAEMRFLMESLSR